MSERSEEVRPSDIDKYQDRRKKINRRLFIGGVAGLGVAAGLGIWGSTIPVGEAPPADCPPQSDIESQKKAMSEQKEAFEVDGISKIEQGVLTKNENTISKLQSTRDECDEYMGPRITQAMLYVGGLLVSTPSAVAVIPKVVEKLFEFRDRKVKNITKSTPQQTEDPTSSQTK